jgi:hypothetical protein
MFEILVAFYRDEAGWPVNVDTENNLLSLTYQSNDDQSVFVASVEVDLRILTVFSRAPEACPADRRQAMCEALVRLNWGMTHGAFTMDMDDGEIRYQTGTDLAGHDLDAGIVQNTTNYNLVTMATYLPVLRQVIAGASADDAVS